MQARHRRLIRLWLYAIAGLVVAMVVVGGLTRLTDSGLSIVEWRPVTGAIPPLGEAAWQEEFAKYRTSSEYALVNQGMSLDAFKRIYWWEWGHRFLGRLIGLAFLVPFLLFHARGYIDRRLGRRLWLILALGGAQGAIGWWMVASGLVGREDVAHERLAVHLAMACLILVAILWTARGLAPPPSGAAVPPRLARSAAAILALVFVQIALGGLVAGLKAGLVYDTWPLIDGALVPAGDRLLFLEPAWRNLLDNHLTVQFAHRMVAYALVGLALLHAAECLRRRVRGAVPLALAILLQAGLGIATLLLHVPFSLALLHQAVAIVTLAIATVHCQRLYATTSVRERGPLGVREAHATAG